MRERSITVDSNTLASCPGQLKISMWRWLLRHPRWPVVLGASLAFILWAAVKVHWGWWVPAVPVLLGNLYYWRRVREHFIFGDVNPGQVISVTPFLIAVRTDLSFGPGYYPVLKIFEEKASGRWSVPLVTGAIVATVSLYYRSEEYNPYWEDFDPHPIDPLVSDLEDAKQILKRISIEEVDQLSQAIEELPSLCVGVHKIEVESSDWSAS